MQQHISKVISTCYILPYHLRRLRQISAAMSVENSLSSYKLMSLVMSRIDYCNRHLRTTGQ